MKAWLLHGFGDMRLTEVPEPALVDPYDVKLRIRVVQPSVTESSLFAGLETYNLAKVEHRLESGPAQLFGHEYSAEVIEVGADVRTLKPGDRVASRSLSSCGVCKLCRSNRRDECQKGPITGFDIPGAFAEYVVVPSDSVVPLPDHLSDQEGAVVQALCDAVAGVAAANLRMGDVVVVLGLGVMGLACAQVARVSGAGRVIATDIRADALDRARSYGIEAINGDAEDLHQQIWSATDELGADVVFETAGGPPSQGLAGTDMTAKAAEMVRDHGTILGLSLSGEAAVLPYSSYRHRSLRYLFPDPLTVALARHVVHLMSSGLIDVKSSLPPVLLGIETVPQAFEMTANKAKYGLSNPAQVQIWDGRN